MKDAHGIELKPDQDLKRIKDGKAAPAGHEYKLIIGNWKAEPGDDSIGKDLIADGGFIRELIDTQERASEFVVVKDVNE